jgi:hypothetical protein
LLEIPGGNAAMEHGFMNERKTLKSEEKRHSEKGDNDKREKETASGSPP